jgi:hypothetical protein
MVQIPIPSCHIPSLMRILCLLTMVMTMAVMTTTATMQVTSVRTRMMNVMVPLPVWQLKLMLSLWRHHVHFYYLTLVEYTNHIYSRKNLPRRHCRWHWATGLHQSHPAIYTQPRTSQLCFWYELPKNLQLDISSRTAWSVNQAHMINCCRGEGTIMNMCSYKA